MSLAKKLKILREKKGVSIKKMAPELGLSYTYLSKLENSKAFPSYEVIEKIAKYFNYNSDELILAAGKIPKDIEAILRDNPEKAILFLREKFASH